MTSIFKITKILILILGFVFALAVESNSFDYDFGWHLRFGQDAWNGDFQYLDSYTWTHYEQPWTNHEWGTDLLYWPIYKNFGYLPILIFFSIIPWLAFVLINKIYVKKLTPAGLIFSFICFYSISHILVARPAMFTLLFFVYLLYSLEKIPTKKYFYLWPLFIWAWSALHGSWIFAFIVINIYTGGQILQIILKKYFNIELPNTWQWKNVAQTFLWQIISGLAIIINPYGLTIWREVLDYFTKKYYQTWIIEWVPSYVYPVFWEVLTISTVGLILIIYAVKQKKVNLSQVLVFIAVFFSAWQYKRNGMLIALLCVPLFTVFWEEIKSKIKYTNQKIYSLTTDNFFQKTTGLFLILVISLLIFSHGIKIRLTTDIWMEKEFLFKRAGFPVYAVDYLNQVIKEEKTPIFNEFSWGAYMNWTLPQALLFFDGRGTATWMWNENTTMLEEYRNIKFIDGGLQKITAGPAEYIILQKYNQFNSPPPDFFNKLLFNKDQLSKLNEEGQLYTDLRQSAEWELVFEDYISLVWKKINL